MSCMSLFQVWQSPLAVPTVKRDRGSPGRELYRVIWHEGNITNCNIDSVSDRLARRQLNEPVRT